MTKQREPRGLLMRYLVMPGLGASVAAFLIGGFFLYTRLSGDRGRGLPRTAPMPFAEAWHNVPTIAAIVFVVTLIILAGKAWLSEQKRED